MSRPEFASSRLHAIVGSSYRLREELLESLLSAWDGPLRRLSEPADPAGLLLGLDTPSLFEPPALAVIRASEAWIGRHRQLLQPLAGQALVAGVVVLVTERLPKNQQPGKQLAAAGCLYEAAAPEGKHFLPWLVQRLGAVEPHLDHPGRLAEALIACRGTDPDAILAGLQQVIDYCGEAPVQASAVATVLGGEAEQPIYIFVDAFLSGQSGKAIRQLHAGTGLPAIPTLAALAGEIRRCLACLQTDDDHRVAQLSGGRRGGSLYYTRKRAEGLGRRCLQRLLAGILQANRELRSTGNVPVQVMETLIQQAQRVIRSA